MTLGAAKVDVNGFLSDGDLSSKSTKYIFASLTNNTLKEGDVITIAIECEKDKGGLLASSDKQNKTILTDIGRICKGIKKIFRFLHIRMDGVRNRRRSFARKNRCAGNRSGMEYRAGVRHIV